MNEELRKVLSDLEQEIQIKKEQYETFKDNYHSYINQPNLICVSSDASVLKTQNWNDTSFYSFTCNLEKPAIQAKSIQLISANIPQSIGYNIPDGELIFCYYRIPTQENVAGYPLFLEQPNINNLYYVRLLPSYYPKNIIPDAQNYGFNRTFNNYQDLADELAKACQNDLLYTNITFNKFVPNDISITYNEELNKFQMTGNNAFSRITPGYPPVWEAGSTYNLNDIVYYLGTFYISLYDNNETVPTTTSTWQVYPETSTTIWNTYLIAGYNDPNVLTLQKNIHYGIDARDFDFNTTYAYGDLVYFNDNVYESLENNNLGNNPILYPTLWSKYDVVLAQETNPDFFYGRYGKNNIVSIPNQPYSKGRTLAKRIGFTWTGSFIWPTSNTIQPLYYVQGSYEPLLWNRMRPIPEYELIVDDLGSIPFPNNNPYTATTYIAESYCNLVYSSILNIYSNITTASSIDTQSRRNILATMPINCAPLGITFTNNFLDNPLTKINADIYQITIELRDENGDPFYITNNGIITFMLKISY